MTHLLIMNGPEGRDFMVEKAIKVSTPYVDSIAILQNGYIEGHSNPNIDRYVRHKTKFIGFEDAYNMLLSWIPKNEHFLILDSDEVPAGDLLRFCYSGEYGDFNIFGLQTYHHSVTNDGKIYSIINSGEGYCPTRFFKHVDTMRAKTFFGTHQSFVCDEVRHCPTSNHFNHVKHDFACWLSSFAHGIALPRAYSVTEDMVPAIEEIRDRFEITPAFIYQNFNNKNLIREVQEAFSDIKDSQLRAVTDSLKAMEFALSTDKELQELYKYERCIESCCENEGNNDPTM
jgi:hypothetical protein